GPPHEEPQDEEADGRVEAMERQVCRVIPYGIHPPADVVEPEGEPGEGHVVSEGVREHPAQIFGAEAAIIRIVDEVGVVVPEEEFPAQRGKEGEDRERCREKSKEKPAVWSRSREGG